MEQTISSLHSWDAQSEQVDYIYTANRCPKMYSPIRELLALTLKAKNDTNREA